MKHILLLESDSLLAGYARQFFKQQGYELEVFADPQAAILAADGRRPDIVVLDLQLAGRSGLEFLYELRSYADWQDIPVIVWSDLAPEEIKIYQPAMDELGVGAYLPKPTGSLAELADAVAKSLQPATA